MHSARRRKGDGSGVNHIAASPLHIVCAICFTGIRFPVQRRSIGHPVRRGETTLRVPIEACLGLINVKMVYAGSLKSNRWTTPFFTVLAFSNSF